MIFFPFAADVPLNSMWIICELKQTAGTGKNHAIFDDQLHYTRFWGFP